MDDVRVPIRIEADIVYARQAARKIAETLGFTTADLTRLATAISELVRNVVLYAGEGVCIVRDESDARTMKIRVIVEDNGPGIPDIALAMTDGYSTAKSLGMGLPGTRRLVSEFDISSRPGLTRVSIAIARTRPVPAPPTRPKRRESPQPKSTRTRPWTIGR